MSTARGGEPRSGAQRLGEPGSFDPALNHLITALTANAHPHELTGRDAALAAFREAGQTAPRRTRLSALSALSGRLQGSAGPRRPARMLLPARLAVAAASVVAVLGGLTAAAAAQALPAPVQQIAYNVLAPLGVPVSQPKPVHPTNPKPSRGSHASPSAPVSTSRSQTGPSRSSSPSPAASATHSPVKKATAPVIRPVLLLVSGKVSDRLVVIAPSDRVGLTVNLTELVGGTWTTVASKPLGPRRRAVFVLPATTAAGHLFKAEIPDAKRKLARASNRLWIPHLPRTGAKSIKPSPNPTTTATTTPDATGTPIASGTPSPSTTPTPPTTSPTPTTSPSPTGSGSPSPTGSGTPTPTGSPTPSPTTSATSDLPAPPTSV